MASAGRDATPRPSGAASAGTIRVDDPGRLTDAAGAFSQALQALGEARGHFVGNAHALGRDLGDAVLSSHFDAVYQQTLRTLDQIGHCFEEFHRALSSAGAAYETTDTSAAGRMR